MARFLFVDKTHEEPSRVGHLLQLYYCKDCNSPKGYDVNYVYPGWIYGPEECFGCNKSFDGNTSAKRIIIDLDDPEFGFTKETK